MIDLRSAKAIYLYPGDTDMRLGIFGLIRKIKNPVRDSAYVFCGKKRMTLKILFYQGSVNVNMENVLRCTFSR